MRRRALGRDHFDRRGGLNADFHFGAAEAKRIDGSGTRARRAEACRAPLSPSQHSAEQLRKKGLTKAAVQP